MPGYLFRPSADGAARPTVVVTNGSDGALSGLWAYSIKPLARGLAGHVITDFLADHLAARQDRASRAREGRA